MNYQSVKMLYTPNPLLYMPSRGSGSEVYSLRCTAVLYQLFNSQNEI